MRKTNGRRWSCRRDESLKLGFVTMQIKHLGASDRELAFGRVREGLGEAAWITTRMENFHALYEKNEKWKEWNEKRKVKHFSLFGSANENTDGMKKGLKNIREIHIKNFNPNMEWKPIENCLKNFVFKNVLLFVYLLITRKWYWIFIMILN